MPSHKLDRMSTGLLLLRLAVGLAFLLHGLPRAADPAGAVPEFQAAGVPWPVVTATFIGFFETAGGLALLAGVATRSAGVLLAAEMAAAITRMTVAQGFLGGWEREFLLLAAALTLAVTGPGEYTLLAEPTDAREQQLPAARRRDRRGQRDRGFY
ncbi:MAG: DoxX family protein [Symbiobacteriia bacterium]